MNTSPAILERNYDLRDRSSNLSSSQLYKQRLRDGQAELERLRAEDLPQDRDDEEENAEETRLRVKAAREEESRRREEELKEMRKRQESAAAAKVEERQVRAHEARS